MTQINDERELTDEELKEWGDRLDELGMTAVAGRPMSDEEYNARIQSVIDGTCFEKCLTAILRRKSKLLQELESTQKLEQQLRGYIAEIKENKIARASSENNLG